MLEPPRKNTGNFRQLRIVASATRSWFWLLCVDLYAVLAAASIPWSTTGVAVFMTLWFIVAIPTLEFGRFIRTLTRPAYWLPVALFALAVLGTFWADGPWTDRLHGLNPVTKLLAIPFLLYHFERSERAQWVLIAFLMSCALLMGLSWIVLFEPAWKVSPTMSAGVPLKNYINQSQEFALCFFALAPLVLSFYQQRRLVLAAVCATLIVAFFANMAFVASARTALLYMPPLLVLFAVRYLNRRGMTFLFGAATAVAVLVWFTSPFFRERIERIPIEYRDYAEQNLPTSTGQRLEYWRLSIAEIAKAPLIGNGTGSTKRLFGDGVADKTGAWAGSILNPHNQTLYVAVQWGVLGCVVLYAMWWFHLLLFREGSFAAWIGLSIVVQNVLSSILNSHLFDFHEGWMYALGVGVAGGFAAKAQNNLETDALSRRKDTDGGP